MEEFTKQLLKHLKELFGDEATFNVHEVFKNNDTKLQALSIVKKGMDTGCNIYLDYLLPQYHQGKSIDDIVKWIAEFAEKETKTVEINTMLLKETMSNYSFIRENMAIRLINWEKNRKYLKGKLCFKYLDFAIAVYVILSQEEETVGTVAVPEEYYKHWNVSKGTLLNDIITEMIHRFPPEINSLSNFLVNRMAEAGLYDEAEELGDIKELNSDTYILTNKMGLHGATSILYPDVLYGLAEKTGTDELILLPSSIHEFIILPKTNGMSMSREYLKNITSGANNGYVSKEDFLSNNIYLYNKQADGIKIW